MKFKVGDRVWFEGKVHTLVESGSIGHPLALKYCPRINFTELGKQIYDSPKPSLKPVKNKKREMVWMSPLCLPSTSGEHHFHEVSHIYKEGWLEFVRVKGKAK